MPPTNFMMHDICRRFVFFFMHMEIAEAARVSLSGNIERNAGIRRLPGQRSCSSVTDITKKTESCFIGAQSKYLPSHPWLPVVPVYLNSDSALGSVIAVACRSCYQNEQWT